MIAQWRHDRRWLSAFFALLLATFAVAWSQADGDSLWIPGLERNSEDLRWTAMAAAFVLGLYASARERFWGTREALLHRTTTGGRILVQRLVACALVLASTLALAMLASRAGWLDRFTYESVWESTHCPIYAAELTCVLPALAVGAVLGASVRGVVSSVLLLVGLGFPIVWWSRECLDAHVLLSAETGHVAPTLYIASQLLLLPPLGALAAAHFTRPPDADAGRIRARPLLLAGMLVLGWAPLVTWGLRHLEDALYARMNASWPYLIVAHDGSVLRSVARRDRHAYAVDQDHRRIQPTGQAAELVEVFNGSALSMERAALIRGAARARNPWRRAEDDLIRRDMRTLPLVAHADDLAWRRAADLGQHEIHLRRQPTAGPSDALFLATGMRAILASARGDAVADAWSQRSYRVALTRPDGQLPRIVDHVAGADGLPPLVLLDGTDGTLWTLVHGDRPDGALHRIPGPGEGPVLRISARVQTTSDDPRRKWTRRLRAVTDAGSYDHVDGTWVAPDKRAGTPETEAGAAQRLTAHMVGDDPLDAALELRDAAGVVVAAHRYQPRTPEERWWAQATQATAVLMPPAALLAARLPGVPAGLEPLVHSGQHDLLIAISLAIALVLAWRVQRRTRRFALPPAQRRFWIAAVLSAGLPAFALHHLLVRRRAWLPVPTSTAPRRRALPTPRPAIDRTLRPAGGTTGGVA